MGFHFTSIYANDFLLATTKITWSIREFLNSFGLDTVKFGSLGNNNIPGKSTRLKHVQVIGGTSDIYTFIYPFYVLI